MDLSSAMLKAKALKALRGNWQSALLVTFFSGILATAYTLAQPQIIPFDPYSFDPDALLQAIEMNAREISSGQWLLWTGLWLASIVLTPVLTLGANHYFVRRLEGEELGFPGLLSRMRYTGKALLLALYMAVKVFLWSLLFVIPGIIAAFRYVMAPYYLAEDPSLSVTEAVEKSKAAMQYNKLSFFILRLSFLGWSFLALMVSSLMSGMGFIIAQAANLFFAVFIDTYMNGACAAFFLTVSLPDTAPWRAGDSAEPPRREAGEYGGVRDRDPDEE